MTTHSEREAFESWYAGRFTRDGRCYMDVKTLEPSVDGGYKEPVNKAWEAWQARAAITQPHPTEVGEAVAWMATHPGIGDVVLFTKFPSEYETKGIAVTPLYTHPAPAAVDGEMSEKDRIEFALRDAGFDLERAFAIAELATANSAEWKVVPDAIERKDAPANLTIGVATGYAMGWNACREAMLNATAADANSGGVKTPSTFEPYGVPKNDREALWYLMYAFDNETWQCPSCGHAEGCSAMDSADFLRSYLALGIGSAVDESNRCVNCDTYLPKGCGGAFIDQSECMLNATASTSRGS